MAVNKPTGDNARKGAVKKRSQFRETIDGVTAWIKRSTSSGEFMAVKKPRAKKVAKKAGARKTSARKVAAKKFKGVRREKAARR